MKHFKTLSVALAFLLIAGNGYATTARLGAPYGVDFNQTKVLTKTTTYTVTTSDGGALINGDATAAGFTITLPSLSSVSASGQSMALKVIKTDSSVNVLTVAPATGDTIGGESARKIVNQNSYMVISSASGKNWDVSFESPYVVEDHEAGTSNIGTQSYGATIVFEGATADAHETTLGVTDPTADVTYQLPTGAASTVYVMSSSLATNFPDILNSVTGASNGLVFEGTADAFEVTVAAADATADSTFTVPNITGTAAAISGLGARKTITAGSGTTTVTTAHCGGVLTAAADADGVFNLPATSAGCVLTFVNIGAAGNNLLTINPDNADQIFGTVTLAASVVAVAGSAGDAVSNTKATTIRGDSMTLVGDGTDGWYITASTGIWADIN
ncbi:MAG: hypothetical protein WA003_15595 [Desulfuromonadaceae bacterium]